jgi:hypothetical protein
VAKRYFPDSIGTDTTPTCTQSVGTLILPAANARVRKERVIAFLTNPGADITTISAAGEVGTEATIICTANTGGKKLTDGSNLKLAGDFTPGAADTIDLVSDGTNWYEVGRSNN